MRYRDSVSFLLTTLLYGGVGYLFVFFSHTLTVSDKKSPTKTIELSLQAYQPPVEAKPEPPEEEIKQKEEIQPQEKPPPPPPSKIEIPTQKPLPKPPEPKKIEIKKPVVKKAEPKKVLKKPVKKAKPSPPKSAQQSSKKQQSSAEERNKFLSTIRTKIDKNKTYPRMAKRRGMQGSVTVSFTILANGHVSGITLSGSNAFHTSAKSAVENAFPVSVKNAPMALPERVWVTLEYRLR